MAKRTTKTQPTRTRKAGRAIGRAGTAVKAGLREAAQGTKFMARLLARTAVDSAKGTKKLGSEFVGGVRDGFNS